MEVSEGRLFKLAEDLLDAMTCNCNADGIPGECECGGDGVDSDAGCWSCQAYTALYGHGTKPREET